MISFIFQHIILPRVIYQVQWSDTQVKPKRFIAKQFGVARDDIIYYSLVQREEIKLLN